MTQSFYLKNMGFAEMAKNELQVINGGTPETITILGNVIYLSTPPLIP